MKFKFKIQQYQTDAVENTVEVFAGQPSHDNTVYLHDFGKRQATITYGGEETGYRNSEVELSHSQLLGNVRSLQVLADIKQSESLVVDQGLGCIGLDVEMETGTGKTYVYIKTMFELNKRYGWSKFIVVVPSIAIREGVAKSFAMLEDHFMEQYGKKARYFIYNSGNLQLLDSYSQDAGINVMIINTQAFASSLKEGGRSKESRIIYSKRDEFASRRPIDVIAANRPIIIMDEPQKMEGAATQTALRRFKPLFVLYYSATHKTKHNAIYALDALDAYKQRLVKRIKVKGFEVKNLKGTGHYLYLDKFLLSKNKPPIAVIDIEVKRANGEIRRELRHFNKGDDLQVTSGLNQYEGFIVNEIDPLRGTVTFLNGTMIERGQVVGDSNRKALQRVQIRETIASHFEKERSLFNQGIKCLSLFFIDEVAHYKGYDENGEVVKGEFWKIFEEEYNNFLNENLSLFDDDYQEYLRRFKANEVHNGYFSIDKKGRSINSHIGRGDNISDDISAYDLILKNKERLLSFEEPTRFIFSHSALREGWDNPNVFQICTLRHAASETARRQEVGRGLRLCVNQEGIRMDAETLGDDVQDVNCLTVIANESYSDFVSGLQDETRKALRERPKHVNLDLFKGKTIVVDGEKFELDEVRSAMAVTYFTMYGYIDADGLPTDKYREAVKNNNLASMDMFVNIAPIANELHKMVQSIYDESVILDNYIENGMETPAVNKVNDNFSRKEFQELWEQINHQYVYTVHYNSAELIEKAIAAIDANLRVTELKYILVEGGQTAVDEFGNATSRTKRLIDVSTSTVPYDLLGEVARGTTLTRRTVAHILQGISPAKFAMFQNNPEEFIRNITKLIKEQKATMIVEHIGYNMIDRTYDSDIFMQEKPSQPLSKAYAARKHILDYVFTDGNTERNFAEALDQASEVAVYAKLPRSFKIPTPVGNYAPDWAIAFNKGSVRHIFFIAETKGSMEDMELRGVEKAKIDCAKKLFNEISTANVKYWKVTSYQDLMEIMPTL